jgi:hypothetical protein
MAQGQLRVGQRSWQSVRGAAADCGGNLPAAGAASGGLPGGNRRDGTPPNRSPIAPPGTVGGLNAYRPRLRGRTGRLRRARYVCYVQTRDCLRDASPSATEPPASLSPEPADVPTARPGWWSSTTSMGSTTRAVDTRRLPTSAPWSMKGDTTTRSARLSPTSPRNGTGATPPRPVPAVQPAQANTGVCMTLQHAASCLRYMAFPYLLTWRLRCVAA